jgi:large subunit ribosomal protein L3
MQDATHGNSVSHRAIGSTGQCQDPGRVFKGKKMAGHMGAEQVTQECLEIVKVDSDKNVILVKGSIPGSTNGIVKVSLSPKKDKINVVVTKNIQDNAASEAVESTEA